MCPCQVQLCYLLNDFLVLTRASGKSRAYGRPELGEKTSRTAATPLHREYTVRREPLAMLRQSAGKKNMQYTGENAVDGCKNWVQS